MDAIRDELPRISVETMQDWKRVQANYNDALLSRLEKEIGAQGLSQERDALLAHIHKFSAQVFGVARPNLRINGRNYEDMEDDEEELEPFDEALDRHIWSLSEQRLKWDREIASERRTKPAEVETLLQDVLMRHRNLHSEIALDSETDPTDDLIPDAPSELDIELEHVFSETAAMSTSLNQTIPSQNERATRMKSVLPEIKSLKD